MYVLRELQEYELSKCYGLHCHEKQKGNGLLRPKIFLNLLSKINFHKIIKL